MRKLMLTIIALTVTLLVTGCSGESSTVNLTYNSSASDEPHKEVIQEVIAQFEEENPGIEIEANFPGQDYEDQLRIAMAANEMPDLFDTHGWAKLRYGEYVMDLSDMDWVEHLDPSMDEVLKDDTGKVYAYPLNQLNSGLIYNENVLNDYGIDPPKTIDEFMEALRTVKEESDGEIVPLWLAGSDRGNLANFLNRFLPALLITDDENNYEEELLGGTFDWSNFTYLPEKLLEMQTEGLLNVDVLTAQNHELVNLMSQGEIAFARNEAIGPEVEKINPDIQVGIQPMPAIFDGDEPSWLGGEQYTVALWKDSEHPEEAKSFIEFLAQPEIAKKTADGTNLPSGLSNVDTENYYSDYYEIHEDIEIQPVFDRIYFPSGLFDVLGTTGQQLLSGEMSPEEVSNRMGEEFTRLREQTSEEDE